MGQESAPRNGADFLAGLVGRQAEPSGDEWRARSPRRGTVRTFWQGWLGARRSRQATNGGPGVRAEERCGLSGRVGWAPGGAVRRRMADRESAPRNGADFLAGLVGRQAEPSGDEWRTGSPRRGTVRTFWQGWLGARRSRQATNGGPGVRAEERCGNSGLASYRFRPARAAGAPFQGSPALPRPRRRARGTGHCSMRLSTDAARRRYRPSARTTALGLRPPRPRPARRPVPASP